MKNHKELYNYIKSDMYRYEGKSDFMTLLKYLIMQYGFQISFLYRISRFYLDKKIYPIHYIFKFLLKILSIIYNVDLHIPTNIGPGIYMSHTFGMFISGDCEFGENVNISHHVTLGRASRGEKMGAPIIGNNVYIGPGVVIIGKIKIGNNVAIGANAVVTKDVPENAVVVGVPARIISYNGSEGYINNTDYKKFWK